MSVKGRVRAVLLIVATVLLAACSSSPTTPVPDGALMAVQSRGGLCREGMCETTVYLERDGLVHGGEGAPSQLGMVPQEAMADLEAQIVTADFEEIRSHPFEGICPTAFDGQELVFEFQAPSGVERIESCQTNVDLDSPLFGAVAAALGDYLPFAVDRPNGPEIPEPPPDPMPLTQ